MVPDYGHIQMITTQILREIVDNDKCAKTFIYKNFTNKSHQITQLYKKIARLLDFIFT